MKLVEEGMEINTWTYIFDECQHQLWGKFALNKVRELIEPQIFDIIDIVLKLELLQSIEESFDWEPTLNLRLDSEMNAIISPPTIWTFKETYIHILMLV